jgi:hypothetical protein
MKRSHWAMVVGAVALGGCGGGGERTERSRDTGGMMGHMDSGGMQMMPQMRAHMDSMMRMSPQQMNAMMARHQGMMSQMMDRMGADMRGMQMSGSSEWNALTDSVKQDLADLPNLKGQELSTRMRAHADRVNRLIAMHEQMMKR